MSHEEYRQMTTWLNNAIKPKMPNYLQDDVSRILEESKPWEVEIMVSNLELTLDEMKKYAEEKGKLESKLEVARQALIEGAEVSFIARITGLDIKTIMELKDEMN